MSYISNFIHFIQPYYQAALGAIYLFVSYQNYLPLWIVALAVVGLIVFLIIKPTPWFTKNKLKILPILGVIILAALWFWVPKLQFYYDTRLSLPAALSAQEKQRFTDAYNKIMADKESYGKNYAGLFNNIGIMRSGVGDYDGAVRAFTQAIKRNPNDPRFYRNLAITYTYVEKYQLAEENFLTAFRLVPTQSEYWLELGELYTYKIKDSNKAKLFYLEAISRSKEDVNVIQAYAMFLEDVVQDYPEAIKYWEKLVTKIGDKDKSVFLRHIEELKLRAKAEEIVK